jgi:hypothetical protein
MVEIEEITEEEFEDKPTRERQTIWKMLERQILQTGKPVKVTGLTRGQVAAGYRALKEKFRVKTDYKNGVLYVAP